MNVPRLTVHTEEENERLAREAFERALVEEAERKAAHEAEQARLKAIEEENIRAQIEADRIAEEARRAARATHNKKKITEMREAIMDDFIAIEQRHLSNSRLQITKRNLDSDDEYLTRKKELHYLKASLIEETPAASQDKLDAELAQAEEYYNKAKKLINDVDRVNITTESRIEEINGARQMAAGSLEAIALIQGQIYSALMDTHVLKQHAEMHLVKHQKLANKPSDGSPPIGAITDLFNQKRVIIEQKMLSLQIERINVAGSDAEELIDMKIADCQGMLDAEREKFNTLCKNLKSIFDEESSRIAAEVMEIARLRALELDLKQKQEIHAREIAELEEKQRLAREEAERLKVQHEEMLAREEAERREAEAAERTAREAREFIEAEAAQRRQQGLIESN